jgi:hypothetical protein
LKQALVVKKIEELSFANQINATSCYDKSATHGFFEFFVFTFICPAIFSFVGWGAARVLVDFVM